MRILVVHNHYRTSAPSGERSVIEQETAGLHDRGHDVDMFERFSDDIDQWGVWRKATAPVDYLWGASSRQDFRATLDRFRPHVVHVHNLSPLISPAVFDLCAATGTPVVATLHNYKLQCASGDFFRDGRACLSCAAGPQAPAIRHRCYHGSVAQTGLVVAGNSMHRRRWRQGVAAYIFISAAQRELMRDLDLPAERTFVKWNFVPEPAVERSSPTHRVAYVGRLDPAKGVPQLMAGWDQYRSHAPDSPLRLAVVGGGPLLDHVRAWAATHASVDVHGMLTRAEAMTVLSRSRCAVVPSAWFETFGLVAVEAMALGVPPVVSSRGSLPELVENEVAGLLVNPDEPRELAHVFDRVDRDPERFRELGLRARRHYEENFTADRNIDQLLDIYNFAMRDSAAEPGARGHRP